jgi:RES domain-containing protein
VFDERLAGAVLQSAPLLSFDGYLTRFVYAGHQPTALEAVGAFHAGGRYNPPGVAALYTSYRRATALSEATQYFEDEDPIKPMLMLSVRLETAALVNLSDPNLLAELETSREELTQHIPDLRAGTALPQVLGRVAEASGRIGGLIVWSRLLIDERNIVLFPDQLGMSYELYDPAGDIPTTHPAISDALSRLMEPPWL